VHAGLFLESRRQAGFWRASRKAGEKKGGQGKLAQAKAAEDNKPKEG
jgi:hypothetical protein